jgi:hypothetical protein
MPTVDSDLDRVQARLHDDAAIWTRAELLRWWNDGYREFLALAGAVRRYRLMDLPGRHTYALTHEWEDRHTTGTVRKPTRALLATWAQGTVLWEAEHLAGVTPTAALEGYTQEWERAFVGETDRHYRFSFPKNHERVYRLMWNERVLVPVSVRELDETDDAWQARVGEPRWWTTGVGRVTSVEIYEIRTDDTQAYALEFYDHGLPRRLSGDRTYGVAAGTANNAYAYTTSGDADALTRAATPLLAGLGARITTAASTPANGFGTQEWEAEHLNGATSFTTGVQRSSYTWEHQHGAAVLVLATGAVRAVTSEDRQYLGVASDPTAVRMAGRALDWRSSADSLAVVEVIVPDADLGEADIPTLIPSQLQKYLRFYVQARAFGRPGEGHSTILADHYQRRFMQGVALFTRLADIAHRDRVYQREMVTPPSRRIPRVSLPSEFPAVFR